MVCIAQFRLTELCPVFTEVVQHFSGCYGLYSGGHSCQHSFYTKVIMQCHHIIFETDIVFLQGGVEKCIVGILGNNSLECFLLDSFGDNDTTCFLRREDELVEKHLFVGVLIGLGVFLVCQAAGTFLKVLKSKFHEVKRQERINVFFSFSLLHRVLSW